MAYLWNQLNIHTTKVWISWGLREEQWNLASQNKNSNQQTNIEKIWQCQCWCNLFNYDLLLLNYSFQGINISRIYYGWLHSQAKQVEKGKTLKQTSYPSNKIPLGEVKFRHYRNSHFRKKCLNKNSGFSITISGCHNMPTGWDQSQEHHNWGSHTRSYKKRWFCTF